MFGEKKKAVKLTPKQIKEMQANMTPKQRKEFEKRIKQHQDDMFWEAMMLAEIFSEDW